MLRGQKSLIYILAIAGISLTSCLKDKPNTDFSAIGTVVELPYAGLQYFSRDAVTDVGPDIVKAFGINVASAKPLSTDTKYTVAVDYSLMTAYNSSPGAANIYEQMPDGSYTIDKLAGTIKAGQRLDSVHVTFDKSLLDPAKSYMLPIKLASASNGVLSGNFNAHYYHFIGNAFAGDYNWHYERRNNGDGSGAPVGGSFDDVVTIYPVTGTQFEVTSGYYLGTERYEVTFEKPDATHFKNFQVSFNPDDVASVFTANLIAVTQQPVIFDPTYDPAKSYTHDEALQFLHYQYIVQGPSGFRYNIDQYTKP